MQFGWLCESLQGYWRKSPEVAGRGGGQAGYGRHQPSGLRRVLLRGTGSRSTELPAPKQHNPTVSPCFRLNSLRFSFLFSFCLVSVFFFLSLSRFALSTRLADTWIQTTSTPESESELACPSFVPPPRSCESRGVFRVSELRCFSRCSTKEQVKRTKRHTSVTYVCIKS